MKLIFVICLGPPPSISGGLRVSVIMQAPLSNQRAEQKRLWVKCPNCSLSREMLHWECALAERASSQKYQLDTGTNTAPTPNFNQNT